MKTDPSLYVLIAVLFGLCVYLYGRMSAAQAVRDYQLDESFSAGMIAGAEFERQREKRHDEPGFIRPRGVPEGPHLQAVPDDVA